MTTKPINKVRVTSGGRVTIPIAVRRTLGIGPGSEVDFIVKGTTLWMVKKGRQISTYEERRALKTCIPKSFD